MSLISNDGLVDNVFNVKMEVKRHFEERFQEYVARRPSLSGIPFQTLEEGDRFLLEESFRLEDLKSVVWEGVKDKSPGPDGFNLSFFKACWDIVKGDLIRTVDGFHRSSRISKAVNANFIVLIPKVDNPLTLDDFRPICLVGSV